MPKNIVSACRAGSDGGFGDDGVLLTVNRPLRRAFPLVLLLGGCDMDFDIERDRCQTDVDCANGQVCTEGWFGRHCFASTGGYGGATTGYGGAANFGGGGKSGAGGNSGGAGGLVCSGEVCKAPAIPGVQTSSCCFHFECGATLGGQCLELDQPSVFGLSCPPENVLGFELPGCCKLTGMCGVTLGEFGCVDPTQFGAPAGVPCAAAGTDAGDADGDSDGGDAGSEGDATPDGLVSPHGGGYLVDLDGGATDES